MVALNACRCSDDGCVNALDALPLKCGLPQSTLEAEDILPKVIATIGDQDSTVRHAAYKVLKRQLFLPDTILKSERLHHLWSRAAFEGDVHCYADGGVTYLNMPSNLEKVQHMATQMTCKAKYTGYKSHLVLHHWSGMWAWWKMKVSFPIDKSLSIFELFVIILNGTVM